jgi:hypothetical protein
VTGKVSPTNEGASGISCDSWTGNQTDQTRPFLDAASQINPGGSQEGGRDASRIREAESLGSWARTNSCLIDPKEIDDLPLVSNSTSEHEVHYRQSDSRAVKRTWPGVYGQVPIDLQMAVFTAEQLKEAGLADPNSLVQKLNSLS